MKIMNVYLALKRRIMGMESTQQSVMVRNAPTFQNPKVVLANDVILAIQTGDLIPVSKPLLSLRLANPREGTSYQKLLRNQPLIEGNVLGCLFVSAVERFGNLSFQSEDRGGDGFIRPSIIILHLRKWFSQVELDNIQRAFADEASPYPTPETRAVGIMNNMIMNNGVFTVHG